MKMISLINNPDLIRKILEHLGLLKAQPAPDLRRPKVSASGPAVVAGFETCFRRPCLVYRNTPAPLNCYA